MKKHKLISIALLYCDFCSAFQLPFEHPRPSSINRFLLAAQDGNLKVVRECLPISAKGSLCYTFNPGFETVDIDAQDPKTGMTALCAAAQNGHSHVVDFLLQHSADPFITRNDGVTPLLIATLNDHGNVITMFLQHGIDPNIRDKKFGDPLLSIAAAKGKYRVVDALLAKGATPTIKTRDGLSPLLLAIQIDHAGIVTTLLRHGIDPNAKDEKFNEPPLIIATTQGKPHSVEALLAGKANPKIKTENGRSLLIIAIEKDHAAIITSLLAHGVSPDEEDTSFGEPFPPLIIATKLGKVQAIKALLHGHAVPDITTSKIEITPLIIAIIEQKKACAQTLLENGANPNYQTQKTSVFPWTPETSLYQDDIETFPHSIKRTITSETPLMLALKIKDYQLARMLLAHDAKVSLTQKSITDHGAYKHHGVFSCLPPEEAATEEDKRMRADLIKALYKKNMAL